MADSSSDGTPKLVQTLGPWQILFYGLGSMLGAGVYVLIGKAAGILGNAMWLAFVAAMIAALLTGLSYASVGSRYPKAGGAAYVTQRATNLAWLSYAVGIAVMMSGLTSMATGLLAIAENLVTQAGIPVPVKLLAVVLALLVGSVIYRGIRESMWLNLVCTLVEVSGLLFIIVIGAKYWGGVNYLEVPASAKGTGIAGISLIVILQGAVLTFFSFIGFEDILNVSEEAKNPRKSIPFGLVGAMIAATLIYMAVSITAVSVMPWKDLAASPAPLMEVARTAAPWFKGMDRVYLFITIFSIGNTALLNYLMGSRLLYGMSRQGLLPKFLGRVHAVRRTPHVAVGVLFLIVTLLILIGGVKPLAEATALLLLSVFVVVNVSLVILKRRKGEPAGGFEVPVLVPVSGALVCAVLIASRIHAAVTSEVEGAHVAPLVAGVIIAASLVMYRFLKPQNAMVAEEN
jgi:amino acid transporter